MKYLIIHEGTAFFTNWFDYENNYVEGMMVIDSDTAQISFDGKTFQNITEDNL